MAVQEKLVVQKRHFKRAPRIYCTRLDKAVFGLRPVPTTVRRDAGFPERSPRRAQLALPPVRACALPSARLVRGAGGAGPISHLSEQAVIGGTLDGG